ncbi:MAG: hypothetical protein ACLP0A_00320 [Verrucomicrobiia bacterium]
MKMFTYLYWVFIVSLWANIAITHYVIYPYLNGRVIDPPLPWYRRLISGDLPAYKMARSSAGEPLTWWYVAHALHILIWLVAIGFWCLHWSK